MKILETKQYKDYWYVVLDMGDWKNGYVAMESDNILLYSRYSDLKEDVNCHGGITYIGNGDWGTINIDNEIPTDKKLYWLGFDTMGRSRVPTEYIVDDCHSIIDQLISFKEKLPATEVMRALARKQLNEIFYVTFQEQFN